MDLSLIVPYHNEELNLPILYSKIVNTFEKIKKDLGLNNFEIIFIDDGSSDNSTDLLIKSIDSIPVESINLSVYIYKFLKNEGQSAALSLGFSKFKGKFVATIDSDLQNDPEDLVYMIKKLINENLDAVSGYRKQRNEGMRVKISNIGNWIIRLVSNYDVKDVGCSLKVYRAQCVKGLKLPHGYHRFLPIITKAKKELISNYPVKHFNRFFGKSHYNYSRIWWLMKHVFTLPFLKGFDINRIEKSVPFLKKVAIFSTLILPLTAFHPNLFYFIFISIFATMTYINVDNFYKYQRNDEWLFFEKVYEKEFIRVEV